MIIDRHAGQLRMVTQSDHAHLSSQLLQLWRHGDLPSHPRRDAILLAAAEHDNGWRESDAAPRVDPTTRRPYDFRSLPAPLRVEVWHRGIGRHQDRHPYESLLIVEHALALFAARGTHPSTPSPWDEAVATWRLVREELLVSSMASPDRVAADYRWVHLADALSLASAERWTDPFERHGYRAIVTGDEESTTLALSPFPLAGATRFRLAYRSIDDRDYASDLDLGTELATARWQQHTLRLVPGADP